MSENKTPGVAWDEKSQVWQTYVPKDGKQVYLGTFKDDEKDLAEGIVMEAWQLPADRIPALKRQYKELKVQRRAGNGAAAQNNGAQGPAAHLPAPADLLVARPSVARRYDGTGADPEGDTLLSLIRDARAADDHARQMAERATQAAEKAQVATQEAITAWNKVAEALCNVADASPSFMQSLLGGRGG